MCKLDKVQGVILSITPPVPQVFRCAGCTCVEPCSIARAASTVLNAEDMAHYQLGDILDFSGSPDSVAELKKYIANVMKGMGWFSAQDVLSKLAILPQSSSFTMATTAHGYAILFVVGEDYTTHPVVVEP